jgi:prepilin-type N-terminal cleavage/methylation domain-containing protein
MRKSAFSLVELLIVIALIVLILAMALPAFNFISGGKSVDAASNQISAFLARARTEAVGLQESRGVMFYVDPASDRQMMAIVKETPRKYSANGVTDIDAATSANAEVFVTLADGADHLALPKGVGIQTINDNASGGERYFGFNTPAGTSVKIGGVILFDGFGKLESKRIGFRMTVAPYTASGAPGALAKLLIPGVLDSDTVNDFAQTANPPLSTVGFVLFDAGVMSDKFGDYRPDPTLNGASFNTAEGNEENWLNTDATAILINRYNGTLIRGS